MEVRIADYEDAQIVEKVMKRNRLQALIAHIQSIPANELVKKWDTEARRIWQNGYNYSNVDGSGTELGKRANKAYLTEIESRWEAS